MTTPTGVGTRLRAARKARMLTAEAMAEALCDAEPVITDVYRQTGQVGSGRTTNLLRRVVERIHHTQAIPTTVADTAAHLRRTLTRPHIASLPPSSSRLERTCLNA